MIKSRNTVWCNELLSCLTQIENDSQENRQDAIEVIGRHPILEELLKNNEYWYLYMNGLPYPQDTDQIKSKLLDGIETVTERSNLKQAVETCDMIVTASDTCELPGYDIVFFIGLKLKSRWDIARGLFAIPYKEMGKYFGESFVNMADEVLFGKVEQVLLNKIFFDMDSVSVLINELEWGPVIIDVNSIDEESFPLEKKYIESYNLEFVIEMFGVLMNLPLLVVGKAIAADRFVDQFLGHTLGMSIGWSEPGATKMSYFGTETTNKEMKLCTRAIEKWKSFSDSDRNKLSLAFCRIGNSLSRSGKLKDGDRVVDIAIALEILYKLDSSEIRHKLSSRAGWYIGNDTYERIRVRESLNSFYDLRSKIVHGGGSVRSGEKPTEIYTKAREIAKQTILKFLEFGEIPNDQYWSRIIMGDVIEGL